MPLTKTFDNLRKAEIVVKRVKAAQQNTNVAEKTIDNTEMDEILQYLNMAIGAINGDGSMTAKQYINQAIAKLSPVS